LEATAVESPPGVWGLIGFNGLRIGEIDIEVLDPETHGHCRRDEQKTADARRKV
jgi:hypothetical protein